MKLAPLILALAILASPSLANEDTDLLLARAWPYAPYARLTELGTGIGIVFSPDLSVPNNCRFYQALGFACFADTDWSRVLDGVHDFNARYPDHAIRTLILETHGTNGNGLKLQQSYARNVERSYISVGALQERLDAEGVRYVIISACNSGRLLRPSIYRNLDPNNGDKLFLPATCGIIGATNDFDPDNTRVTIVTPASSHIEMTVVGSIRELKPETRKLILRAAEAAGVPAPKEFAVSDLLMEMLLRSPVLRLRIGGGVDALSREKDPEAVSERLYSSFLRQLDALARREPQNSVASHASR